MNNHDLNELSLKSKFEEAEKRYKKIFENEKKIKDAKKAEKLNTLSKKDQMLIREKESMIIGGYGFGLRTLLFFGIFALLMLLGAILRSKIEWDFFVLFVSSALIACLLSFVLVFIFNGKARARRRRMNKILSVPAVREYYEFCRNIDKTESEEYTEAYKERRKAEEELFKHKNSDTLLIYAPKKRTDDTLNFYKSLALYIDGNLYSGSLNSGVTKIKLTPAYHSLRFETTERAKNQDGLVAAYREGKYGGANTCAEFSCQINMMERKPCGIVLDDKDGYIILEDISLEDYEEYFY